ncbi:MAG TPA: hypothetical protein VF671_11275 [Pseudomonas sp.]|jgi:hypothetical protein|uniref:hypothetical protein n=1 Tax=Pseudomonas sp. TaxID=306 RepID=UPI002EDAB0FA
MASLNKSLLLAFGFAGADLREGDDVSTGKNWPGFCSGCCRKRPSLASWRVTMNDNHEFSRPGALPIDWATVLKLLPSIDEAEPA